MCLPIRDMDGREKQRINLTQRPWAVFFDGHCCSKYRNPGLPGLTAPEDQIASFLYTNEMSAKKIHDRSPGAVERVCGSSDPDPYNLLSSNVSTPMFWWIHVNQTGISHCATGVSAM